MRECSKDKITNHACYDLRMNRTRRSLSASNLFLCSVESVYSTSPQRFSHPARGGEHGPGSSEGKIMMKQDKRLRIRGLGFLLLFFFFSPLFSRCYLLFLIQPSLSFSLHSFTCKTLQALTHVCKATRTDDTMTTTENTNPKAISTLKPSKEQDGTGVVELDPWLEPYSEGLRKR